jgi:CDP-4-dehydro-6-deoxyglucose reductase
VNHRVSLHGSDQSFFAEAGETVLAASRRAGLALPYSCLAGRCGSCHARLVAGEVAYPFQPPLALSEPERRQGEVLLCQATAESDLCIAIREVAVLRDYRPQRTAATLIARSPLASEVWRVRLRLEQASLRWLPGQYLQFILADGKRRAFSIASRCLDLSGELDLHVRHVQGGSFTDILCHAEPGARFDVELPLGSCVPRPASDRPLLLIAGGTGYGPISALLAHFLDSTPGRALHLYRGARAPAELYLDAEVSAQAAAHGFHYVRVLSDDPAPGSRYGLVHEAVLADFPDCSGLDVYMSGPPPMVDAARHALVERGLPADRLYYDSFEYAPDVLAALLHAASVVSQK